MAFVVDSTIKAPKSSANFNSRRAKKEFLDRR